MDDLNGDTYRVEHDRRYEEIRAKHPGLVTVPFSCHVGWFGILARLFDEIAETLKDGDPARFELRQVKEKFGGLRVYFRYGDGRQPLTVDSHAVRDDDIDHRIMLAAFAAECRSQMTCEICGNPGLVRVRGGWWSTRCDEHGPDMEPRPSAGEQAAWVPEMTVHRGDSRVVYAYDRKADKVVLAPDEARAEKSRRRAPGPGDEMRGEGEG